MLIPLLEVIWEKHFANKSLGNRIAEQSDSSLVTESKDRHLLCWSQLLDTILSQLRSLCIVCYFSTICFNTYITIPSAPSSAASVTERFSHQDSVRTFRFSIRTIMLSRDLCGRGSEPHFWHQLSRDFSDYRRVLDRWPDLVDSDTARDYTLQFSVHSHIFSAVAW
jgi:hypothetical protein